MAQKLIIISDPGIDGAFAIALALQDPELEVLGLAASAGNVNAEQATQNLYTIVSQVDPPRWPRLGAALPINYDCDATRLHGANGLGGEEFPCARLHHEHPADKLTTDLIRQYPHEATVLLLGPATALASALDRDPELASLIDRIVMVGGSWREPGDISAVAEFHFFCDPASARQVLRCGTPITLLTLDVTRQLLFSPGDLLNLPAPESPTCRFLSQITPNAIAPSASLYGAEGLYLQDVLGVIAVSQPDMLSSQPAVVDIETTGELTRGMSVFDMRWNSPDRPNAEMITDVDLPGSHTYIRRVLKGEGGGF